MDSTREIHIQLLKQGETQWGHTGRHHGKGTEDCPRELHHHHDVKCAKPTREECEAAGVEYRERWDSRG